MVRLTQTLSNLPRPLERLIDKLGEHPASAPRRKIVNKVTSAKSERRAYKPNRRLLPEEVQGLVVQYEAGASIADLAREYGMHTQTIDSHLKRQGVLKRGVFKLSPEQVDDVTRLYADGWSTIEIAKKFDVTTNTVSRALARAGMPLRSAGEAWRYRKSKRSRRKKK